VNTAARRVELPSIADTRGLLAFAEAGNALPFVPARCFFIARVPEGSSRGGHAHRACAQFLVAPAGRMEVTVRQPMAQDHLVLDDPRQGLYVPPMHWLDLETFSADAVLVVLASHGYDPDDYLRSWDAFVAEANRS
jgi:UDP-2-acetamido-3-amino-2,3-dideoxy-glucuronate N-acetyltransferase